VTIVIRLTAALVFLTVCPLPLRAEEPRPWVKPGTPAADPSIEDNGSRVVGRDRAGRVQWSASLTGPLGGVLPTDLIVDPQRVYLARWRGVTALDRRTGEVRWHSGGPCMHLYLSAGLLLAVDCAGNPRHGRWLVARAADCGAEEFRVRLPLRDFDPGPIQEVAGLFLVQSRWTWRATDVALLIDRRGNVFHRLDRQVLDGRRYGPDLILLTSTDVIRLAPDGRGRWSLPFRREESCPGGQLVPIVGGDLLASQFGCISDSGVQLMRLDPDGGKVVWQTQCPGLRVSHSKYQHNAMLAVEKDHVKVTSHGSAGSFEEILGLRYGDRRKRTGLRGE
jgi:hypothetical protein